MKNKMISVNDLESYFGYSKKIAELEETLYETGDKLSQKESKIENVVAAQNKIRFDENGNDLFRDQVENVIQTLAANYKNYDFDKQLYFDLVYNLLMQEYERIQNLIKENGVSNMLQDLNITDHLKEKIKALLDHEKEGCGSCH